MRLNKKIIVIVLPLLIILSLSIGSFAYYKYSVNGSIKVNTGKAVFVLKDSDSAIWDNKVIDLGNIVPGDSGEFSITMDASGSSVSMYATLEIEKLNLPSNLKFYTTSDHKAELHKYYSFLEKNVTTSETLNIYWYWNPYVDDIEDSEYINVTNLQANIKVEAIQINEYAVMKNGYSGSTEFWNNNYKPYISTITFGNDLKELPNECTEDNLCWDITDTDSKKKVYGYLKNNGNKDSSDTTKSLYDLYIVSDNKIFAPDNCEYIFREFTNLNQISFNNNFNTSNVVSMYGMFFRSILLLNLDVLSFNTKNVTKMDRMFFNLSMKNIDLSSFNTSNVLSMESMFNGCSKLAILDLNNFNVENVKITNAMFAWCVSLSTINVNSFNTKNVTNMANMFYCCYSLISLDLGSFNTSNVIDMHSMFSNCTSLTDLDLYSFNTIAVTRMDRMFEGCLILKNLNLSNFNTSNATNMEKVFYGCSNLQTTINILNASTTYTDIFANNALTDENANVIIGYTTETKTIAEAMKETAGNNKNKIALKQL